MSREVHVRFCESRGVRFPPGYSTGQFGDKSQFD